MIQPGLFIPLVFAAAAITAVASSTLVVEAGSAQAQTPVTDPCLVGVWEPDGNGAVEWMRRNMPPGMSIPTPDIVGLLMLNSDGSYSAGSSGGVQAMTTPLAGETAARAELTTKAAGRWSTENGKLVLSPVSETVSGQMQITTPDGSSRNMAMPSSGAMGPTQYEYSCSEATMETSIRFPGMEDAMVQRYRRSAAPGG